MRQPQRTIGQRIKELREHLQKDQDEFGIMLGVKQPTISGWENGTRFPEPGRIKDLVNLARSCEPPFNLTYNDFYSNGG